MDDIRAFYDAINYGALFGCSGEGQVLVPCPFHDDKNPSLSVNLLNGLWNCRGCGERGNAIQYVEKIEGVDFKKALELISAAQNILLPTTLEPIDTMLVDKWHKALMTGAVATREWLNSRRGLSDVTLVRYQIGFDGERITIPIYDDRGNLMNVRRYAPKGRGVNKMLNYKKGHGGARLFPAEALVGEKVLISEGEMDCIITRQHGFNVVTATAGANTWRAEWNELFRGKDVVIVYDVDAAGRDGAHRVACHLYKIAKTVKVVDLNLSEPPGADLTNWFVDAGYTEVDLQRLIDSTELFEILDRPKLERDEKTYKIHLSQVSHKNYYYKRIEVPALVCGKDLAPFLIPRTVEFNCGMTHKSLCGLCGLGAVGGKKLILNVDIEDARLLSMLHSTDKQVKGVLRDMAHVLCSQHTMDYEEMMNIEELRLCPEIDYAIAEEEDSDGGSSGEYVVRQSFYIGHGLRTNVAYTFNGVCVPEPCSQYAVTMMKKASPLQDDITTFDDVGSRANLCAFSPEKSGTVAIEEKLADIHQDYEHHVTYIYERPEILMALDMVYHSLLSFDFNGVRTRRGWIEGLVIGDTRCGKSETARRYIEHVRLGELITGENSSYAGLVGGLQQMNKRWSITWGKIPLNDRRVVVIDETSSLDIEEIAVLSGVRSEGIAEITKIQTERTMARTRKLWMSNPRSTRPLATYNAGVEAIAELIGRPEDIARFDFAVAVASGEVDMKIINKQRSLLPESPKYSAANSRALILWAWSRKPDQIIFTPAATELILDQAGMLDKRFGNAIPLVTGAEQRIKLARLSAALSARLYSTDDGTSVVITENHVFVACEWLWNQFCKPSLAYDQYSDARKNEYELRSESSVRELLLSKARDIASDKSSRTVEEVYREIINNLLSYSTLRRADICDVLNLSNEVAGTVTSALVRERFLKKPHTFYVKTPAGIAFLRAEKVRLEVDCRHHGSSESESSSQELPEHDDSLGLEPVP